MYGSYIAAQIAITLCGRSMVWRNVEAYYKHMLGPYTEYRVWGPHIYMCLMHSMQRWGPVVWGPYIYMCLTHTMLCSGLIVWGPHIYMLSHGSHIHDWSPIYIVWGPHIYMGLTHTMLCWGLIVWGPHIYMLSHGSLIHD